MKVNDVGALIINFANEPRTIVFCQFEISWQFFKGFSKIWISTMLYHYNRAWREFVCASNGVHHEESYPTTVCMVLGLRNNRF